MERLRAVCSRHGVPLGAAALQFPLGHPLIDGWLRTNDVFSIGYYPQDDLPFLGTAAPMWTEDQYPRKRRLGQAA